MLTEGIRSSPARRKNGKDKVIGCVAISCAMAARCIIKIGAGRKRVLKLKWRGWDSSLCPHLIGRWGNSKMGLGLIVGVSEILVVNIIRSAACQFYMVRAHY